MVKEYYCIITILKLYQSVLNVYKYYIYAVAYDCIYDYIVMLHTVCNFDAYYCVYILFTYKMLQYYACKQS